MKLLRKWLAFYVWCFRMSFVSIYPAVIKRGPGDWIVYPPVRMNTAALWALLPTLESYPSKSQAREAGGRTGYSLNEFETDAQKLSQQQ